MSIQSPVSAGLYPIFYTDYKRVEFILRPELGIGFNLWSITIGYNIHSAGYKFEKVDNFTLSLKMFIPISMQYL